MLYSEPYCNIDGVWVYNFYGVWVFCDGVWVFVLVHRRATRHATRCCCFPLRTPGLEAAYIYVVFTCGSGGYSLPWVHSADAARQTPHLAHIMSDSTPHTHAQRRLLSNKSAFNAQGAQSAPGASGASASASLAAAAHVSSSLNSQIYASRQHSLQQLQMREQYAAHAAAVAAASNMNMGVNMNMGMNMGMGMGAGYYMQGADGQPQMPVPQQYAYSYNYSYSYQGVPRGVPSLQGRTRASASLQGHGRAPGGPAAKGRGAAASMRKHSARQNLPEAQDAAAAAAAQLHGIHRVPYASVAFRAGKSCEEYSAALRLPQQHAIVNLVPKRAPRQPRQHSRNVYRLHEPLGKRSSETNGSSSLLLRSVAARSEASHEKQPLLLGGSASCRVAALNEFTPKLFDSFFGGDKENAPPQPQPQLQKQPRQLQLKSGANASATGNMSQLYNDSFDLSFDGKAMDRSDVFRMVDSFSVAFSDNEHDNGNDTSMMQNTQSVIIQESPDESREDEGAEVGPLAHAADDSMAPGSSSSIMVGQGADGDEPSFIVGPTDTILPAEITSGSPSY